MSTISLVLADSDSFFSGKFSRYILEHNNIFDVITFTQPAYLLDYLQNNSADILLLDKDFISEEVLIKAKKSVVIILDDNSNECGEYYHINKYQKTESIVREITFKYAESVGDKSIIAVGTSFARTISVYSPTGGSGKTTIALATAGILAGNGYKVVYLNMEKFNSAVGYLNAESTEGLSEIFLKLKNKSKNLSFEVMKRLLTDSSGIQYFGPVESAMEFNEMSKDEITAFVEEITGITDLDYLIVDLPAEFNQSVIDILKLSNDVVFVLSGDAVSINKTKMFLNEINIFADLRITYEKFMPVINKSMAGGISQNIREMFGDKSIMASIPVINGINSCCNVTDISELMCNYLMDIVRIFMGR